MISTWQESCRRHRLRVLISIKRSWVHRMVQAGVGDLRLGIQELHMASLVGITLNPTSSRQYNSSITCGFPRIGAHREKNLRKPRCRRPHSAGATKHGRVLTEKEHPWKRTGTWPVCSHVWRLLACTQLASPHDRSHQKVRGTEEGVWGLYPEVFLCAQRILGVTRCPRLPERCDTPLS